MKRFTGRLFSIGIFALLAACGGSMNASTADPLCGRQRDNDQRCNPSASACLRTAIYNQCVTTKPLYRAELETSYLTCYPATLGCDSAAQSAALKCAQTAEDAFPVSAALMQAANNICQRCLNAAKDGPSDATACATNLTTNANDLGRTLRFYRDETLTKLSTCLVNASPPADGCIAFSSCYQSLLPPAPTCTGDGGA